MLYRISVAERGLTGIANIFRSRLSGSDDLSRAGTVPFREKSEYSRPGPVRPGPARPDPITLFKVLYLRNRMSDRQAVFFDEYHLNVKVV